MFFRFYSNIQIYLTVSLIAFSLKFYYWVSCALMIFKFLVHIIAAILFGFSKLHYNKLSHRHIFKSYKKWNLLCMQLVINQFVHSTRQPCNFLAAFYLLNKFNFENILQTNAPGWGNMKNIYKAPRSGCEAGGQRSCVITACKFLPLELLVLFLKYFTCESNLMRRLRNKIPYIRLHIKSHSWWHGIKSCPLYLLKMIPHINATLEDNMLSIGFRSKLQALCQDSGKKSDLCSYMYLLWPISLEPLIWSPKSFHRCMLFI